MIVDKIIGNNTVMLLDNGNRIIVGNDCVLTNTRIKFTGSNNILKMGGRCHIINSVIEFNNDESVVVLSSNIHNYYLNLSLHYNNTFYMGENNYINSNLSAILSEQKHIFFGRYGTFSFGIFLRNADPHLIYSMENKKRLNPSKSIFVGDHVWIGQRALLLKGTKIGSGSVIGAESVIAGKLIPSNTSWAGNPARQVKTGVFWSGQCVHSWLNKETQKFKMMDTDEFIFENKQEERYSFNLLDKELSDCMNAENKLSYLERVDCMKTKNRFFLEDYNAEIYTLPSFS